jgi:DNA-binding FrmR family transcriptional regulator
MIENDEYCIDVLTQLSSVTAALQGVAVGLVDEHLRHCVLEAAAEGGEERDAKLTEAMRAVERLVRS